MPLCAEAGATECLNTQDISLQETGTPKTATSEMQKAIRVPGTRSGLAH